MTKKLCLSACLLGFLFAVRVAPAFGQDESTAAKTFNFRSEAIVELKAAQNEIISLAQAMPQEKYTWRPADGVRSVSEVYLHIAAGNFGLTAIAGAPPYPGFKFQGFEKSTTDKAKIIDLLNQSYAYAEKSIGDMSDADMSKPLNFQGFNTVGAVIFHLVAHDHEHLGQSIAYARMNGVVPPWTAAAQAKMQQRSSH
ncbi:MAG TPA: DinB family protein [Candidatus Baltobacteraceae bacterium]|nr:DinB family protein [Candidatus Baltobacteraceae bacterium]